MGHGTPEIYLGEEERGELYHAGTCHALGVEISMKEASHLACQEEAEIADGCGLYLYTKPPLERLSMTNPQRNRGLEGKMDAV